MAVATVVLTIPFAWHLRRTAAARRGALGRHGRSVVRAQPGHAELGAAVDLGGQRDPAGQHRADLGGAGGAVLFREKLGRRYWAGLALALAGAAVVTGFRLAAGVQLNAGDALAFVGAIFYAGYLLNTQRARRDLDTLTYLWLVAATAAVRCWRSAWSRACPSSATPRTYLALFAMGIISQTGGWLLINYALGHLPASTRSWCCWPSRS